jgi:RNA polymerase sigma-70 factor, ECF subfamily
MDTPAAAGPLTWGGRISDDLVDDDAFDALVQRTQRRVQRVLLAILGDADAAATLTQDCFLRAYRARDDFRGQARVETWLISIAVNLARDHIRSRRQGFWRRLVRGADAPESDGAMWADPAPSAERAVAAQQEVAHVFAAVKRLSARQREVFVLRFVEEMTLAEIAEAIGVTEGAVKAHLHRAIGAIRERVKEER